MRLSYVVGLAIFILSQMTYAENVNDPFNGLTEQQRNELILKASQMRAEKKTLAQKLPDPEILNQYAQLGENIAIAAGSAAKQLGMAADDFSRTGLGKVIIVLVAWKVMGDDAIKITSNILNIIILFPIIIIYTAIWFYMYRISFIISSIQWEKPEGQKKYKKKIEYQDGERKSDGWWVMRALMIAIWIIPCAIIIGLMVS